MLTSVKFEMYRGFDAYRLEALAPVNLLVGKNNCGKTSVLEAVHFLAAGGDPNVLGDTAWRRGEVLPTASDRAPMRPDVQPDISHFFHGHEFGPGTRFRVASGDGLGAVKVTVVPPSDSDEEFGQPTLFDEGKPARAAFLMRVETDGTPSGAKPIEVPVSADGALLTPPPYRVRRSPRSHYDARLPVQFIAPDSLQPNSMNELWDLVLRSKREKEVIEAMQILDPDLADIVFLSSE